ncbi:ABC transporter permease [Spiroplasma diminutum]|uniref:Transmembrane protein n=1 Tax=Spiroplasma diminutum CUAS-1 TaxID=1276221 RepID=S5M1T1_9MOLU|nr:ABC transporter permease [Spiroplasma diminutum]AGR42027.1 transmembrane protein [Spiroplasma diminutum CUAS-1]
MKKSLFLYLKQGIKGVMKFKIQFIVIVFLSFLATFILSISFSTTQRIENNFETAISKMKKFDYVNQKVVGTNLAEDSGTNILAPLDLINSQFLYVKNSQNSTSYSQNRTIDLNINISSFEDENEYNENFITKTFSDTKIQKKFLDLLTNPKFLKPIFSYDYSTITEKVNWNPFYEINHSNSSTSYTYLNNVSIKEEIKDFYIATIETLKENFIEDIFAEVTPTYLNKSLFLELKNKEIISEQDFKNTSLENDQDNNLYSRYLYFSLESIIRQLINSVVEYPVYWINKAIEKSIAISESREREDVIKTFNEYFSTSAGFNFLLLEDSNIKSTSEENKIFAITVFKWIFGFSPTIDEYNIAQELDNNFIVKENNRPWKNSIDLGNTNIDTSRYLNSKSSVFENGMRGSLNQLIVRPSANTYSIDKTFNTNYLKHYDNLSIEQLIGEEKSFGDLNNYANKYNYSNINTKIAYFMRNEMIASLTDFDYMTRAEMEFTDLTTEISYRVIDIEGLWKDKITLYEGNMPKLENEILINPQFAKTNKYKIGQNIKLGENNFVISGFATDPLSYYPMGNTQNPLPNNKKNAIVYANSSNFRKIIEDKLEKTVTKSIYNFFTYNGNNNLEWNNIQKFKAYSFNNIVEVYNSYNFIMGNDSELNTEKFINNFTNYNSSNFKLNWTIAPSIIFGFRAFSYIFLALIFLITITATIIAVKKTVHLNSGEIGILKSMGVRNWEISISYLSYGIVVGLFIVPLAWILGSFIQEFSSNIFLQFTSGRFNLVVFSPLAFLISFFIFGFILCLISFLTALFLVKKPALEIINKTNKVKRIKIIDSLNSTLFKNKSFSTRFSMELAISGFSKTLLSSTTIFFAAFFISFGLTIPGLVQNVVGSYYKNIKYQNSFTARELIGNAPLAKTSLSASKEVDEYDNNLMNSNGIFGDGITKIGKNVTDFASSVDSSAFPQILLSENENKDMTAKWTYDEMASHKNNLNIDENNQNSLIAIIASILGNNIKQLVGKSITIADVQKLLEWVIHSDNKEFENDFNARLNKVNELSNLLTDGLPQLLTKFISGSSISEGNWKEQIIDIIISQTPSYIKQYVIKSENRLNNFMFGWQVNKYIPGEDTLYTSLDIKTKNNQDLSMTGLLSHQNAYSIKEEDKNKVFINDYQAQLIERVINDEKFDEIPNEIKDYYDGDNIVIPVIANDQTNFLIQNDWNNLTDPFLEKTRLILKQDSVNIPNLAWMYDDGDWIKYNKKENFDNGYLKMDGLSPSKFTYAPIFNETGFNLIKNTSENLSLVDNSYGFYNLTSDLNSKDEEVNLEIRPYYSFDNITLFIPEDFKENFEKLKFKGNKNTKDWWYEDASFIPEVTRKAWGKLNPKYADLSQRYFAIKPYSLNYDNSGNYTREKSNLSGQPVENISQDYENYFGRSLRDEDGPITFAKTNIKWNKKIKFKQVGSINVYGTSLMIIDQNFANILNGYGISKYIPFNLKYETSSKPTGSYSEGGIKINTFKYIEPLEYYDKDQNELIYGDTEFEKSIRPSNWYNGMLSNSKEPYFITSQASFSRDIKTGQDILNGSNYGSSVLELNSTHLLGQQKTLIFQLSAIILSSASIAISLMILIIILTVTLINDLYVNQYKKFMIVMKSLGYSNWNITRYTFGTVTILSLIFYILGVITNFIVIGLIFNLVSKKLGSIPFGLTWWSPILAIILVFGSFIISIMITTRKIRKESPSTLMN